MNFKCIFILIFLCAAGCVSHKKEWGVVKKTGLLGGQYYTSGFASYYDAHWSGHATASGERYDPELLTAASPTLSFGTRVLVRSPSSGKFVVLRINDRGPYVPGRILDVSLAAAKKLQIRKSGVSFVDVYILKS